MTRQKIFKLNNFLILEILILVAIIMAIAATGLYGSAQPASGSIRPNEQSLNNKPLIKTPLASPKVASSSPSAKPTPKPTSSNIVPQSYGRSVRVPILMYHYIGGNPNPADTARNILSTAPDIFDQQMGLLSSRGYTPVTLDTLYAALKGGLLPAKPIVLTFDDGYVDFYVNAFPILRKYGFHAVSFIPTSLMSQGYYMSWNQISEIQSSGLIAFEAHSLTHPNLVALSPAAMQNQIVESKKVLEAHVGVPVNFFAYPYGISDAQAWEDVKGAGYVGAVGTWYGVYENEGNVFDMPRIRISGGLSIGDFAAKL